VPRRLRLKKDLSRHLAAGHPWVFRDALAERAAATGEVVDVCGPSGRFLARGLFDAGSPIAVRVYTRDAGEALDGALVARRVGEALRARRGVIDARETDAFRWLNGEGDLLPGVVVDLYAEVAVVRLDGDAVRGLRDPVVRAVAEEGRALGVRTIVERSRGAKLELLWGPPPPERVPIREAGVRFAVDVAHGQKTGTFLDQRENRRAIRPFADRVEVANLFAYAGGFSVHAALAGATRVASVDSAAAALDDARENFRRNKIDPARHEFAAEDCFEWLARARDERRRFGLVIVDPPSFAPSEKAVPRALAAYRDLNAAALALVEPGGVLAAASCSSHVTMEAFASALAEAGVRARRELRLLELRGQPGDHPSPPAFPEGRYLKMALARVG
jgi:23S rRNA (cytosine1962-C5)-methyltransferase